MTGINCWHLTAKNALITKRRTCKPRIGVKYLVGRIDVLQVITAFNLVMTGKVEELPKAVFRIFMIAKADCSSKATIWNSSMTIVAFRQ